MVKANCFDLDEDVPTARGRSFDRCIDETQDISWSAARNLYPFLLVGGYFHDYIEYQGYLKSLYSHGGCRERLSRYADRRVRLEVGAVPAEPE